MKKNIVLLSLVVVMVSAFAFAGIQIQLRANIPFPFYVEDQLLPAGEYNFEMGNRAIVIRTKDGVGVKLLATMGGANQNKIGDFLRFNQYGDKYFLSGVATGRYKANVKSAKLEQEVRTRIAKAREVVLMAKK